MSIDLSSLPPICEHCIQGKQTLSSVPKVRQGERAKRPLERVYADLTGPMDVVSANRNRYALDILDDCSGHLWSIPLQTKDAAFGAMTTWILRSETKYGYKVGTVVINRGELASDRFDKWCAEKGINIDYTAPHTSAHNGRCERLRRTLMGKARAM